nr:ribosomal protein S3 [Microspora sp. UTEX LB472]
MGQKIHPIGFRVGITKKHRSQWFARFHKHQYSQAILEDHIIRQTLLKLFGGNSPELLNSNMKKINKSSDNLQPTPKITQIKIERGLIPYEIGIQIHAGNCDLIKSSIDNLKINQTLTHQLQKSRYYFLDLRAKLKDLLQWKRTLTSKLKKQSKIQVTKTVFNQKLIQRRLRKRRGIRRNFDQSVLSQLFMVKKGTKLTRQIQLSSKMNLAKEKTGKRLSTLRKEANFQQFFSNIGLKKSSLKLVSEANSNENSNKKPAVFGKSNSNLSSSNRRKFINLFVSKMNQSFLIELKTQMKYWNTFLNQYKSKSLEKSVNENNGLAPLGYQRKWSLTRLNNLKKQPLNTLRILVKHLQSKALLKLDVLRNEFVSLGSISKIQSFAYYQMMTFIKSLKLLVRKLAKEQVKFQQNLTKRLPLFSQNKQKLQKWISSLPEIALRNKINNLDNEGRKLKFIYYLKDLVKKHRTEHLYYYLSTIADSHESLKKIQQFQKKNVSFLFGIDLNNYLVSKANSNNVIKSSDISTQIQTKVKNIYFQTSQKSDIEKGLQEAFLDQLQKQKTMYQQNIQLTPKILMKFYSVKESSFQSKASLVADSIVDDLEKRKVFRRVIKQAKENLMSNPGVKGVKIQVAGRLNGAEIARTEWVRSGRVPLQTLRANIDYSYKTASTIYGIIGVKVWIYKGYAKALQGTTQSLLDFVK